MNPDDTLGGHQWTEGFGLDDVPMNTNTYYLQYGGMKNVVSEFVVFRDEDKVVINGSEIMNKVSARMRWDYLIKEGWKQTYE
jgi:hypothetical protein